MRIAALVFALLGTAGSGFLSAKWTSDPFTRDLMEEATRLAKSSGDPLRAKYLHTGFELSASALIGAAVAGVVGGVLALARKGKLAAVLLLAAYATPPAILGGFVGFDFSDDRVKSILLFPAGLAVGGLLALLVRPTVPHKKPKSRPGIPRDADMVG